MTLVSHYLVQYRVVPWVELGGCARVSSVSRATQGDKESVAGDGAVAGAALVDGHGREPLQDMRWPTGRPSVEYTGTVGWFALV
ncbi:hypothetical protein [Aeromonas jandaei]|uniref:hypothetical protein n=1 Tax=Aeromonas jandaei TaxID=650 RepID=UPI003F79EAE8